MITRGSGRIRSWMFIYAGLIAAIALAGEPRDVETIGVDPISRPAIMPATPVLRQDI